jgi:flagellar basal body-associated protein FliL
MRKLLLIAGGIVLALAACVGATIGIMKFVYPAAIGEAAATPVKVAAKPLFFASIDDVTVSVPPDSGDPATSYVEFGMQFATHDQHALETFSRLQPIIKADIINILMSETTQSLQDANARAALIQSCLKVANDVLSKEASYTPANPFTAGYITNLVVQD